MINRLRTHNLIVALPAYISLLAGNLGATHTPPFSTQWTYQQPTMQQPAFASMFAGAAAATATAQYAAADSAVRTHQRVAASDYFWIQARQTFYEQKIRIDKATSADLVAFAAEVDAHIKARSVSLAQLQANVVATQDHALLVEHAQKSLQYLDYVKTYISQKMATDALRRSYQEAFRTKSAEDQQAEVALLKKEFDAGAARVDSLRAQAFQAGVYGAPLSDVEQALQESLHEHERTTVKLNIAQSDARCVDYKKEFASCPIHVLHAKHDALSATIAEYETRRAAGRGDNAASDNRYQDCLLQRTAVWDLLAQKQYTVTYAQNLAEIRTTDIQCATESACRVHSAAIDETVHTKGAVYQTSYLLEPAVKKLLADFHLPCRSWEHVLGNAFEHTLIKENIDTLTQIAAINDSWKKYDGAHEYISATTHLSAAAIELTHVGATREATWATNVAQALLQISDCQNRFTCSFIKGLGQSAMRTIDMVRHPIQTAQELAEGAKMLGSLVWQANTHITHAYWHPVETNERLANGIGRLAACIDQIVQEGMSVQWERAWNACSGLSAEKVGICAGNIVGDLFVPGVIAKGARYASSITSLEKGLLAIKNMAKAEVVTLQALSAQKWTATRETLQVVAPVCSAAATAVGAIARPVGQAVTHELLKVYPAVSRVSSAAKTVAQDASSMVKVERYIALPAAVELESLQAKCQVLINRLAETAQLPVKIVECDIQHILGFDCRIMSKASGAAKFNWKGFHHDPCNILRDSKVIELANVIEHANGIVEANVIYQGIRQPKTIFPAIWESEKVLGKIFEACENLAFKPEFHGTNWILRGITQEGIKVRVIVTTEGLIKSAYPVVSWGISI